MKKIFFLLILFLSFTLLISSELKAVPITFTDSVLFTPTGVSSDVDAVLNGYGGSSVNWLSGNGDFVTWTHKFTYIPAADSIIEGQLAVTLYDDEADMTSSSVTWERGTFYIGGSTLGTYDVNTSTYRMEIEADYLLDGSLQVKLVSLYGDFRIDRSDLTVTYDPVVSPVPEPSTLLLLGSGLSGLVLAGMRRYRKS